MCLSSFFADCVTLFWWSRWPLRKGGARKVSMNDGTSSPAPLTLGTVYKADSTCLDLPLPTHPLPALPLAPTSQLPEADSII